MSEIDRQLIAQWNAHKAVMGDGYGLDFESFMDATRPLREEHARMLATVMSLQRQLAGAVSMRALTSV